MEGEAIFPATVDRRWGRAGNAEGVSKVSRPTARDVAVGGNGGYVGVDRGLKDLFILIRSGSA